MRFLTVLVTLSVVSCEASHLLLPKKSSTDDFSNAIIAILRRHFVSNHASTMITQSAKVDTYTEYLQIDILDRILLRTSGEIAYVFSTPIRPRRPRFFNILLFDGYLAFRSILRQLHPNKYDFSGYYLLILTAPRPVFNRTIQQMFIDLWSYNIVNVVLAASSIVGSKSPEGTQLFTYFPYVEHHCEHAHPVLLYNLTPSTKLDKSVNLFPPKLSNFHGCPIRIAAIDYPPYTMIEWIGGRRRLRGIEGDMLNMISSELNFTYEVVEMTGDDRWGQIYGNGTFTGAIKLVVEGSVNMSTGCFSMRGERMSVMRSSASYYTIKMMFAVPPGRPYTAFEKMFRPFSAVTWMMVTLYTLAGAGVILVLQFYPWSVRNFVYGRSTGMAFMNFMNIFFGGAMSRTPGRNFARALLFLWLLQCFVMRTLYQGSLFEYLQQSKNFSHVDSLKRIEAEKMPYIMSQGNIMFVRDISSIRKRTTLIPDRTEDRFEIFRQQSVNYLQVAMLTAFDHLAAFNERFYKRGIVHVAKDVLITSPICFYYPQKSCLAARFDVEIGRIQRAGLIEHWLHGYIGYRFFRKPKTHHHIPMVLTNEHLLGCYETWLAMLVLACGLFAMEVLSERVHILRRGFDFLVD
ncbi:AAEL014686-PA [Aedes aegypti]|uniref:AAEL014686-PA n=2 Tax=Aedes aegypti TaxID=7159 RepID=Q16FP4_AEDAE|nr:ionotropic receptor 7f precursor [Aedes aegypti]EAT33057.1 AAEL014686-PA [Aedes aegypti]